MLRLRVWQATVPLGVLAFWGGLWMAARHYPSEYDWRYMTISSLLYADRNPEGFRWAWGGLMVCALGGLSWAAVLIWIWRREGGTGRPIGISALAAGYICMVGALMPGRIVPIPKAHEILALSGFLGLCFGIVSLTLRTVERHPGRRPSELPDKPRRLPALLAGAALVPVVLAGVAPAYVSHALPDLPWVGIEWRERGVPVFLSFAFWEWITCVVFSAYTMSLCLIIDGPE